MVKTKGISKDQQGFASIAIALILIIVLALLTIGFAQLARREQQNALDKHLATQAYYAAETGINDAVKQIKSGAIASNKTTCAQGPHSSVGSANGVSYTCVLVDIFPPSIEYGSPNQAGDGVKAGQGRYMVFSIQPPLTLSALTIRWTSDTGRNTFRSPPNTPKFAPLSGPGQWSEPAVIQFSITPLSALDRVSLQNNTFNVYLYPAASGSVTIDSAMAGQGQFAGDCDVAATPYNCAARITNLNGSSFLMHFINYYDDTDIKITGVDGSGNPVNFSGAQASIDATGKARDTLRRLHVRVPLNNNPDLPDYALEGKNICKRLTTEPNGTGHSTPTGLSDQACDPYQ